MNEADFLYIFDELRYDCIDGAFTIGCMMGQQRFAFWRHNIGCIAMGGDDV